MQNHFNLKHVALLLGLLMPAVWCGAHGTISMDGYSQIIIKENNLHGITKGNTIQATLDGHWHSVTFTQDVGTLTMELEMVSGPVIFNYPTVQTPDSYQFYLNQTGDYIITFTLSNGDEYYGEFTITN